MSSRPRLASLRGEPLAWENLMRSNSLLNPLLPYEWDEPPPPAAPDTTASACAFDHA